MRALNLGNFVSLSSDHTVFYRRNMGKLTILNVYVHDIVITGDDDMGIENLKKQLTREFEVKDLGQLYFLGIEVSRSPKCIYLSQIKYVLDLLAKNDMLGCRPASTPIEQKHKLSSESGETVNKEQYQRLVGRLIYLSHTRLRVVSQFMHDPKRHHMNDVM
jgi:hypothetical protein